MLARFSEIGAASLVALTIATSAPAEDGGPNARSLYQEGARLYNLGQYEDALRAFEEAYAITGAKPLLFNIAQAHRLAGPTHCERALRAYESYLREDASASNRSEVEERIVEMRRCVDRAREAELAARRPPEAPTPPAQAPAPAEQPPSSRKAPLVLAIGGGALFVIGAGLYTTSRIKFEQERAHCPCPEGTFSSWQTVTTTSYFLMAAGGAAAVTGITWWMVARPHAASYAVTARPSGLYVTGTF